jgi:hypothetical protein
MPFVTDWGDGSVIVVARGSYCGLCRRGGTFGPHPYQANRGNRSSHERDKCDEKVRAQFEGVYLPQVPTISDSEKH